jgi:uncharacterized membrane protein YphA (DoxX/SURF4 family)
MYEVALLIHNVFRWIALILGIVATVYAFIGWFGKRKWMERDRMLGTYYTMFLDIQLLLGLILYFYSPFAFNALRNQGMSYVMGQSEYRFFAVEHLLFMILALVFAHLGSILSKKAPEAVGKFKRAAIFYGLSLLFILIAIPWDRPLFRLP